MQWRHTLAKLTTGEPYGVRILKWLTSRAQGLMTRERFYKAIRAVFSAPKIILIKETTKFVLLGMLGFWGIYCMAYGFGIVSTYSTLTGFIILTIGTTAWLSYSIITFMSQRRRMKELDAKEKEEAEKDGPDYGFQLTFFPLDDDNEDTPYGVGLVVGNKMGMMRVAAMLHEFSHKLGDDAKQADDLEDRLN